jgi:hypothetical protein
MWQMKWEGDTARMEQTKDPQNALVGDRMATET